MRTVVFHETCNCSDIFMCLWLCIIFLGNSGNALKQVKECNSKLFSLLQVNKEFQQQWTGDIKWLFHENTMNFWEKVVCESFACDWDVILMSLIKFPSEASRVWFVCKVDIYTTNLIFNCQTLINSLGNLYSDHCVKSVWRICFEVFKPENQLSNSSNRSGQVRTQFIPRDNLFMVPHQRTTIILTSTERSQKN